MRPVVSVVIPTFNHAHFLARSLESVVRQSFSSWEALVIDNHSTDNTDEVVASFNDRRIVSLKIHNHGVIGVSRNLGIRHAQGQWISFLDADDYWYPQKLASIMHHAGNGACDVISNDEWMVDLQTGRRQLLRHGPYRNDFYRTLLVDGNCLSTSATTIRHDVLTRASLGFAESADYTTVEDYDLWLNLARCGASFLFLREILGEYVCHGGNSSANIERHWRNGESLLRHHVFSVQQFEPRSDDLWRQTAARLTVGRFRFLLSHGQFRPALKEGLKMISETPLEAASYVARRAGRFVQRAGS